MLIGVRTVFGGTCIFRSGSESQHEVASLHKSTNMAMHVPKAPGFAQMLKDGAKVFKKLQLMEKVLWYVICRILSPIVTWKQFCCEEMLCFRGHVTRMLVWIFSNFPNGINFTIIKKSECFFPIFDIKLMFHWIIFRLNMWGPEYWRNIAKLLGVTSLVL